MYKSALLIFLLTFFAVSYFSPAFCETSDTNNNQSAVISKDINSHDTHSENKHIEDEQDDGGCGGGQKEHSFHVNGEKMSILWALPFVGILLSIALLPLIAPHFWHRHYGKVSLFWGVLFFILFTVRFGFERSSFYLVEVYLLEYIPFIILLLALFTVSGGIRLKGSLVGKPSLNVVLLLIGTVLASWMGTTGAAMLLIRPIIKANSWRKYQKHTIIFFIFLVANIGGSLTPLGDPPLFLGYLKGVDFFWTTTNLAMPMLLTIFILIGIYYALDCYLYSKETDKPKEEIEKESLGIEGSVNFLLLPIVIVAVLISSINCGVCFEINHVQERLAPIIEIAVLLFVTYLSLKITKKEIRIRNDFNWEPIKEVAKLFATIFLTMVAPIEMLKAGSDGPLGFIIDMVKAPDGTPIDFAFFWATGTLSSFLDNAPTYVVFFETAGGNPEYLMTTGARTLLAISAGAVFMGANTYIGNAPNFMVKSIAEQSDIKMPSFFGYIAWSVGILVPVFLLISFIYF